MAPESMRYLPFILYIGPDVLMPVATAVAAIAGFLMMFWRRSVALVRRGVDAAKRLFGKR